MKKHNVLAATFLALAMASCNKDVIFAVDSSNLKQQYNTTEKAEFTVTNPAEAEIDSVVYMVNGKRAGSVKGNGTYTLDFKGRKLGYQEIQAQVYSGGHGTNADIRIELVSHINPKLLEYEIVNTYPHDTGAYTQGLEFYRDTLIEGTGQYGYSNLRKTDYKTGKVYNQVPLGDKFFGEGITVLNNKIYQLTWRETTGYIYNADNLKLEKQFEYFRPVEGWGLTNDGKHLYQSDGTEKIWKLDPTTLKEADYINVYTSNTKITAVNELEWINGKIYGNIYQKSALAVIDPQTGAVEAVIDLSALETKINRLPDTDVLNGIAYNPRTKTIFVTGKKWDKMFEIRIK